MTSGMRFAIATLVYLAGSWYLGWWAVPVVALAFGANGMRPMVAAGAATTAWLFLLLVDAAGGSITRLAAVLAGVMGLPAPALFAVTLLFAALLAWSAASVGDAARSLRATSRRPS